MCQYLFRFEAGRHPGVLLQSAARVIVRRGVPLKVVHQLGHGLLHLQRHDRHNMILTRTLTVQTDLPAGNRKKKNTYKSVLPPMSRIKRSSQLSACMH